MLWLLRIEAVSFYFPVYTLICIENLEGKLWFRGCGLRPLSVKGGHWWLRCAFWFSRWPVLRLGIWVRCALLFCMFSASFLFGFGIMGVVLQGSEGCGCAFVGLVWRFAGCCNLVGSLLHFLFCCCGGLIQSDHILLKKQGSIL